MRAMFNVMEEACGIVARKIPESTSRKQNYSNDAPNNMISIKLSALITVGWSSSKCRNLTSLS